MCRNLILWMFTFFTIGSSSYISNSVICQYPCQCPVRELKCESGVSIVKNGCGCCYMCARQHGELCNVKDVCDVKQDLFCDLTLGHVPGVGICKANVSKPCIVDGVTYQDGDQFKPVCSRLCTCQNGNVGCVELCPDEHRMPSISHCKRARLISVGECCKQWTCDVHEPKRGRAGSGISTRHISNDNRKPMELRAYTMIDDSENSNYYQNTQQTCNVNETRWSPCSKDCEVGVSSRTVIDAKCKETVETRLCYLRPCNTKLPAQSDEKCTPTSRMPGKQRLKYEDCISVKDWNLKFCTNCKRRRCCYPRRERTRKLEFQCTGGRRETFSVMWIKSCRCDKKCYKKDPVRSKSRRSHPKWLK